MAELMEAAYQHRLNTQSYDPLGVVPRDAFARLWRGIGDHTAERLASGRGVQLPRLGTISLLRPPDGFPDAATSPIFLVDPKFAAAQGIARFDPKPVQHMVRNHPYSWAGQGQHNAVGPGHALNFSALSTACGQNRDRTRRMYDILVSCIGDSVREPLEDALPLPPLGELRCGRGALELAFDDAFCQQMGVQPPALSPRHKKTAPDRRASSLGDDRGQRPRRASGAVTPPSSRSSSRSSSRLSDNSMMLRQSPQIQFTQDALATHRHASSLAVDSPPTEPNKPSVPTPKEGWGPKPAGFKSGQQEKPAILGDDMAPPLPKWWIDMKEKIAAKSNNVRTLFRHFDADKSGSVDREEFVQGLRSISVYLSEENLDELMAIVDEDGMGDVDYNEFARKLAASDLGGMPQSLQGTATPQQPVTQKPSAATVGQNKSSTIVAENRLKLTDEQRGQTHRLCRVLDVFFAFDKSGSGVIKDFDLVLGINSHFGIHISKDEGRELVAFLSKGAEDATVSRVDFTRAYMSWERLCSIDDQKKGIRDFIAMVPMFRRLADPQYFGGSLAQPKKFVKLIAQNMTRIEVPAKSVIIRKGEVGNEMFFLVSGRAEIMVRSLSDPAVAEKEPGSFFGESALLNAEPRNAYVRAKTECVLYVLSKESLDDVMKDYPEIRDLIRPPNEGLRAGRGRKQVPFAKKGDKSRRLTRTVSEDSVDQGGQALKATEVGKLTLLKNVPLFQAMPDTFGVQAHTMDGFIHSLVPLLKRVELPKGRYIVREGDFGDAMFFIAEGRLEVVSGVQDQSEFMLHQGNCFGELALVFRERRTKSVRSATPVVIYRLSANDFQACLVKHPEVSDNLVYMAEQRRMQVVRGGKVPEVFERTARIICDDMISVAPSAPLGVAQQPTVPAWQLRTLLSEILPLWPIDAIDWLLAGGAEPLYTLSARDRLLSIEYNRVLLPKSVQKRRQSAQRVVSSSDMQVWGEWKRIYSKTSEQYYYWHAHTKTSCWEPPADSPWFNNNGEESPDAGYEEESGADSPRSDVARPKWWNGMVSTIESKTTNIRQVFRKFDADRSGTVDYEECFSGLQSLGVSLNDDEFEELISIIDADGSGEISYFEFAEMLATTEKLSTKKKRRSSPRPVHNEDKERQLPTWWKEMRVKIEAKATNVQTLFRSFDADKSGTVDVEEFRNGLHYIGVELSESQFAELLDMVDADGGGQIDYTEFAENLARADDQFYSSWFSGEAGPEAQLPHQTLESETFIKLRGWVGRNGMDWETAFRHFRKARSGELNAEDFERAVRSVNSKLSAQQLEYLMRCVDRDGGGSISLDEWLYHFDDRARSPDWETGAFQRLRDALAASSLSLGDLIRRADTSGDGTLSVGELARAIMGVGFSKEEATDMAHATDTDRTGNVVIRVLQNKLTATGENEDDWQDRVLNSVRAKLLANRTPQDIAVAFSKFDFDGDGSISRSELARGMNMLGIKLKPSEIDHLMDVCDEDGNGELDFNEFVTKILDQQPLSVDEIKHVKRKMQLAVFDLETSFKKLFDEWNVTRSGFLSLAQFTRGLDSLPSVASTTSKETVKGIFVSADRDGDGYLSYTEFAKFFEETKSRLKSAAASRSSFSQGSKAASSPRSPKDTGTDGTKALQNLRDRIFHRKVTLMEVFRSFDDDYDGFISSDEFLQGLAGDSKSVAACLGDLRDLELSYQAALDLYKKMDTSGHGFVDYEAFCEFLDEKLPPDWDEKIVDEIQKHLHKQGLTSEELFDQWNIRHDGALDVGYFSRGLKSIGVMKGTLTDSMCQAFFNVMDRDHDGLITIREFNEQFSFRVARFDWKQNAMQIITKLLAGRHKTPFDAFVAFQNRSMRKSMRPMNSLNFQRYFDGVDAVLALRLKKWEWRELFLFVDKDMDNRIGEQDFVDMLTTFKENGRVVSGSEHEESLSSADVFRRADKDCDGFLDRTEFEAAAQIVRPGATTAEIERGWTTVGGTKAGRVDLNGFARYIAGPTEDSWQMHTMEKIRDLLKTNRGSLQKVIADIDTSGTGVLSMDEFREAMNRLGLALSRRKCDALHRRIDVNCTGGIKMEDLIGWATGSFVEGPLSDRTHIIELTKLHLGSAENLFVWIQKKFKLKPEMAMSHHDFARGVKALYNFSPVKQVQAELERYDNDLEEATREMFAKAGGRNGAVSFSNFLEYFTEAGDETAEASLPPVVAFLSQHRTAIGNVLGKAARSKASASNTAVSWSDFQQLLQRGWGGPEGGLDWSEDMWATARALADPQNTGQVEFKTLLNRCQFRANMVHSRNSRKTGRIARTKLPRANVIQERAKKSVLRKK
jgi:Ca2+-binding EF-hand superfamily protein/CRP-like cAMP-binding protein